MLEKTDIAMKRLLKVIVVRTQKEASWKESLHFLRKCINHQEKNTAKNMDGRGHSDEVSERNEEPDGNWSKGGPCYKVAKNLVELHLCSNVLWKVELVSDEIGCLTEEVSKHNVEEVAWFLLAATVKCKKTNKLKAELLSRKEAELKD